MPGPKYTEAMIRAAELRFMVQRLEVTQREISGVVHAGAITGLTIAIRALRARADHLERLDRSLDDLCRRWAPS